MSQCNDVLERLYEYLNSHDVTPEINAEIQKHLDLCRHCFTRYEFEIQLMKKMKSAGCCSCPDSLRKKVQQLLEKF